MSSLHDLVVNFTNQTLSTPGNNIRDICVSILDFLKSKTEPEFTYVIQKTYKAYNQTSSSSSVMDMANEMINALKSSSFDKYTLKSMLQEISENELKNTVYSTMSGGKKTRRRRRTNKTRSNRKHGGGNTNNSTMTMIYILLLTSNLAFGPEFGQPAFMIDMFFESQGLYVDANVEASTEHIEYPYEKLYNDYVKWIENNEWVSNMALKSKGNFSYKISEMDNAFWSLIVTENKYQAKTILDILKLFNDVFRMKFSV